MLMTIDDLRQVKARLRNTILALLKTKKEEELSEKSRSVKGALFRNQLFKQAKTVMFYVSLGNEVNTSEMIKEALRLGKRVVVPVCSGNRTIEPCEISHECGMRRGPYGILEPAQKQPVPLDEIDLVVVPGLAFDENGRRLGRGKGYYDRFLSLLPRDCRSIGVAFDFQILPSVPVADHDVNVHTVIFA
jgi:5-formyltetrahydrofolate cyclo-ligase